jgi:hypothetical protein
MIRKGVGLLLILSAFSPVAQAGFTPEIDPGSMVSALTLCAGGMMLMVDRFYHRK